jgi:hypothetical protein
MRARFSQTPSPTKRTLSAVDTNLTAAKAASPLAAKKQDPGPIRVSSGSDSEEKPATPAATRPPAKGYRLKRGRVDSDSEDEEADTGPNMPGGLPSFASSSSTPTQKNLLPRKGIRKIEDSPDASSPPNNPPARKPFTFEREETPDSDDSLDIVQIRNIYYPTKKEAEDSVVSAPTTVNPAQPDAQALLAHAHTLTQTGIFGLAHPLSDLTQLSAYNQRPSGLGLNREDSVYNSRLDMGRGDVVAK